MEKEGNVKYIPKKEQGPTPNFNIVFPDLHKDSDVHTPCGFCGLKYCSVHFVLKGGRIRCQKCDTWYHEVCLGRRQKATHTWKMFVILQLRIK